MIEELTFAEQVQNVIGCLEYFIQDKENMGEDSEAYAVANDAEQSLEFLYELKEREVI